MNEDYAHQQQISPHFGVVEYLEDIETSEGIGSYVAWQTNNMPEVPKIELLLLTLILTNLNHSSNFVSHVR